MRRSHSSILFALGFVLVVVLFVQPSSGADHRDAPIAGLNPAGDITDVFAFVDPNDPSRIVVGMGVNSFAVPSVNGTYKFSPDMLYQFKFDNNGDAKEDFVIQLVFSHGSPQTVKVLGPAAPRQAFTGALNRLLKKDDAVSVDGAVGGTICDPNGVQVFTGLRDDPFVFDVSQFNRILGGEQEVFRDIHESPVGPLRGRPVRQDGS